MPTTTATLPIEAKKVRERTDKLLKQIKIILKLAKINGYDLTGRILGDSGNYIEKTDIIPLLAHAMTPGRILAGEMQFIRLLKQANVEPELIINDNVRSKLLGLPVEPAKSAPAEPIITEEIEPDEPEPEIHIRRPLKRKLTDRPTVQWLAPPESRPTKIPRRWVTVDDDE